MIRANQPLATHFYSRTVICTPYGPVTIVLELADNDETSRLFVRAMSGQDTVGYVTFSYIDRRTLRADTGTPPLEVRLDWRRRGIATAMYDAVEKHGYTIEPSGNFTEDGLAFWRARVVSKHMRTRARPQLRAIKGSIEP